MVKKKNRNFSTKLRSLFGAEGWKRTPEVRESTQIPSPLAALNSGIPFDLEITTRLNHEPITTGGSPSDQVAAMANARDTLLTPSSPLSLSSITAYTSGERNDHRLNEDQERTYMRYQAAVLKLKEALDLRPELWSKMDPLKFADVLENDDTSKLRAIIQNRFDRVSNNASPIWKKGRKLFEQIFVVFFPLTRNLLLATKDAQSVCPCLPSVLTLFLDSLVKPLWTDMQRPPSPSYGNRFTLLSLME